MEAQEIITAEAGTVALLNKSEIDMQVATAHKYPRSVKRFRDETLAMVTLNENVAQECIYSLPRDGKNIEGPSARFAEVVASAWGNSRAGARVVSDVGDFVTAQGVFHDLERSRPSRARGLKRQHGVPAGAGPRRALHGRVD